MEPTTTAALIAGGSQLLSGLGGMLGGGTSNAKARGATRDAYEELRRHQRESPKSMVKGFEDAGIHPIYGMGSAGAFSSMPSVAVGGETSSRAAEALSAAGHGIGRAMEAKASADERRLNRELAVEQVKGAKLDNQQRELAIAATLSQASLNSQAGTPPGLKINQQVESHPRHIYLHDSDGKTVRILNPAAGDNEPFMMADYATSTLPDELSNMFSRSFSGVSKYFRSPRSLSHRYRK